MDIDELQDKWCEMNSRLSKLENAYTKDIIGKKKTAQEKLVSQYRVFSIISALFIIISLISWWRLFGAAIGVIFAVYFLMTLTMDLTLMKKVAAIDMSGMPVTEVARRAIDCRRLHHIFQIILIPIAVLILGYLCYTNTVNEYFIWGCVAGAAIGIIIGLRIYFRMMSDYKKIIQ